MILYKIEFGPVSKASRHDAEHMVYGYISGLLKNGQACGEEYLTVQNGKLCVYINLTGTNANFPKNHCEFALKNLNKSSEFFGQEPVWTCLDDNAPKRETNWKNTPFLYFDPNSLDLTPPILRGDNGKPVPLYLIPKSDNIRESIYFFRQHYKDHYSLWMKDGDLELPAYKQLAEPVSKLSKKGREISALIEEVTSIPTYYYLHRYWARRENEEKRKCPGCGGKWRTSHSLDDVTFWHFPFQCKKCRLVSQMAISCEDERHARIGEWKDKKK